MFFVGNFLSLSWAEKNILKALYALKKTMPHPHNSLKLNGCYLIVSVL